MAAVYDEVKQLSLFPQLILYVGSVDAPSPTAWKILYDWQVVLYTCSWQPSRTSRPPMRNTVDDYERSVINEPVTRYTEHFVPLNKG